MLPFSNPRPQDDLQALYFQAVQAHNQGDLKTARQGYEQILSAAPNQVDTNFQLGRLLVQDKLAKDGLKYLEKATYLAPATFEFWRMLVETMAGTGMKKQAKRAVKRAGAHGFSLPEMSALGDLAARDPSQSITPLGQAPQDQVDRAVFLLQSDDLDGAENLTRSLARDHGNVAFIQNLLGVILMQKQAYQDAGEHFAQATGLDPFFPDAFGNLGKAYLELDDFEGALDALKTALDLAPDLVPAQINTGLAHLGLKKYSDAERYLESAIKLLPQSAECRSGLASAQLKLGKFKAALKNYELLADTFTHGQEHEFAVVGKAECLGELGKDTEQLALLEDLIARNPEASYAKVILANAYSRLGNFERARDLFHSVLTQKENAVAAFQGLGQISKWQRDDPFIEQAAELFETGNLDPEEKASLGFALAKMFSDTKQDDRVFFYLNFANAELRRKFKYSTQDARADFKAMMNNYPPEFFEELRKYAVEDATPIFILGLPRSGTTITEQIISNHPDVAGGGELSSATNNFLFALTNEQSQFRKADGIDPTSLQTAARTCIEILRTRFPDKLRITDKLPHTFVLVGFLLTLLPNAKIVHVFRNPVDNCLSIYKNQFRKNTHRYSNDLRELGDYYAMYVALMNHWRALFPGQIIEAEYDAIVSDPDTKIRALIADLGLGWNDACLETQTNTREIKTLSIYQARQPIYKTSSHGWKRFEKDLAELTDALRAKGVTFD